MVNKFRETTSKYRAIINGVVEIFDWKFIAKSPASQVEEDRQSKILEWLIENEPDELVGCLRNVDDKLVDLYTNDIIEFMYSPSVGKDTKHTGVLEYCDCLMSYVIDIPTEGTAIALSNRIDDTIYDFNIIGNYKLKSVKY